MGPKRCQMHFDSKFESSETAKGQGRYGIEVLQQGPKSDGNHRGRAFNRIRLWELSPRPLHQIDRRLLTAFHYIKMHRAQRGYRRCMGRGAGQRRTLDRQQIRDAPLSQLVTPANIGQRGNSGTQGCSPCTWCRLRHREWGDGGRFRQGRNLCAC